MRRTAHPTRDPLTAVLLDPDISTRPPGPQSTPFHVLELPDTATVNLSHSSSPEYVLADSLSKSSRRKALDVQGLHHSGFDVARGKTGVGKNQKLDLERHPEKARATHRKMRAKDRPLANDFMSDADFEALLRTWFGNASRVLRPGGGFYIWGGFMNLPNYPPALKASGLHFSQALIWVKEHPVLTRKDFMTNHELAFYGWREGAAHRFFGPPNVPDVWRVSPGGRAQPRTSPFRLLVTMGAGSRANGRPRTALRGRRWRSPATRGACLGRADRAGSVLARSGHRSRQRRVAARRSAAPVLASQ